MQIENKQIVEFVGIGAVVLSVLFLAYEIRQSNRIATGTVEAELRAISLETNRAVLDISDETELLHKLVSANIELSPTEVAKARMLARLFVNLWEAADTAFTNGLISDLTHELFISDIGVHFDEYPGLVPYFAYLLYSAFLSFLKFPISLSLFLTFS